MTPLRFATSTAHWDMIGEATTDLTKDEKANKSSYNTIKTESSTRAQHSKFGSIVQYAKLKF